MEILDEETDSVFYFFKLVWLVGCNKTQAVRGKRKYVLYRKERHSVVCGDGNDKDQNDGI